MEALMTPLRQRMLEDMQIRNLSPNTQASYVLQVSLFARHFGKSLLELSPDDIRTYQIHLMNERKLAPQSILIAVSAIRFLYRVTLKRDWIIEEAIPTCKKPQKLPAILKSGGGGTSARVRAQLQTTRHPDHLLCSRSAHLRSYPLDAV